MKTTCLYLFKRALSLTLVLSIGSFSVDAMKKRTVHEVYSDEEMIDDETDIQFIIKKKKKVNTCNLNPSLKKKLKIMFKSCTLFTDATCQDADPLISIRERLLYALKKSNIKGLQAIIESFEFVNKRFIKKLGKQVTTASLSKFVVEFETALEENEKNSKNITPYLQFKEQLKNASFVEKLLKKIHQKDILYFSRHTIIPFINICVHQNFKEVNVFNLPKGLTKIEHKHIIENFKELKKKIENDEELDKDDISMLAELIRNCNL